MKVHSVSPDTVLDILAMPVPRPIGSRYGSSAYPQDRHESYFSWGTSEVVLNHHDFLFRNGTYGITVRCQAGYRCTGMFEVTVNGVEITLIPDLNPEFKPGLDPNTNPSLFVQP